MTDIKAGDVVQLKSGGQKMTVESTTETHAKCTWCADGEVRSAAIGILALQVFEPKPESKPTKARFEELGKKIAS